MHDKVSDAYNILIGESEGKNRSGWDDNSKTCFKGIGC
jgi:hypothetical protein